MNTSARFRSTPYRRPAPKAEPTIFLISQISRHGHLDSYARLYSRSLVDLGYRVALICERDVGIADFLPTGDGESARLAFFTRAELSPERGERRGWPAKVSRVLREEGAGAVLRRVRNRVVRASAPLGVRINFFPIIAEINAAKERLGVSPALVFFLYLDFFNEAAASCRRLDRLLDAPWSGILFHPRGGQDRDALSVERYFSCRNARGALFLNPDAVDCYRRRLPNLTFASPPDVTDTSLPERPSDLGRLVAARANGRSIVLLFGTLSLHKGMARLIEVIQLADPKKFFFAIVGEPFWREHGAAADALQTFFCDPPENCFPHFDYVDNEQELNSIIASSDIIYAVYDGFLDSSNSLTKAAAFGKPILVGRQGLMARRVEQYNIGKVVPGNGPRDVLAALEALHGANRSDFSFDAYRRDHSLDALKASLAQVLPQWLER